MKCFCFQFQVFDFVSKRPFLEATISKREPRHRKICPQQGYFSAAFVDMKNVFNFAISSKEITDFQQHAIIFPLIRF